MLHTFNWARNKECAQVLVQLRLSTSFAHIVFGDRLKACRCTLSSHWGRECIRTHTLAPANHRHSRRGRLCTCTGHSCKHTGARFLAYFLSWAITRDCVPCPPKCSCSLHCSRRPPPLSPRLTRLGAQANKRKQAPCCPKATNRSGGGIDLTADKTNTSDS